MNSVALPFCLRIIALLFLLRPASADAESLRLIGRSAFPDDLAIGKTKLGGLSGISYDAATKSLWAVCDDSAYKGGPPRAYRLSLNTTAPLQPKIESVLILRDEKGRPFPVADSEGIACTGRGGIWVTSEGRSGKKGALPWLRLFSLDTGRTVRSLPVPKVYLPADAEGQIVPLESAAQVRGVLTNKSLESCTLSPDLRTVYIANETSLAQEKARGEGAGGASFFNGTQVRISAIDTKSGRCVAQKLYVADAGCLFGSVSDLSAQDDRGSLLVLERRVIRLQEGTGACGIRIYRVNLRQTDATDLREIVSVRDSQVVGLTKTLVYDSQKEGLAELDNIEGIGLLPLSSGRTGLVAVSDDNFSKTQETQILLYELLR